MGVVLWLCDPAATPLGRAWLLASPQETFAVHAPSRPRPLASELRTGTVCAMEEWVASSCPPSFSTPGGGPARRGSPAGPLPVRRGAVLGGLPAPARAAGGLAGLRGQVQGSLLSVSPTPQGAPWGSVSEAWWGSRWARRSGAPAQEVGPQAFLREAVPAEPRPGSALHWHVGSAWTSCPRHGLKGHHAGIAPTHGQRASRSGGQNLQSLASTHSRYPTGLKEPPPQSEGFPWPPKTPPWLLSSPDCSAGPPSILFIF